MPVMPWTRWTWSTTASVWSWVLPPAPYVTDTKSGRVDASLGARVQTGLSHPPASLVGTARSRRRDGPPSACRRRSPESAGLVTRYRQGSGLWTSRVTFILVAIFDLTLPPFSAGGHFPCCVGERCRV